MTQAAALAALAAQQCDSCGDDASAPFTSRKLLRFFKALAFFALLATTGVGAGVAYWLGARRPESRLAVCFGVLTQ